MKKQLLAVGDSFTYGEELDDIYQAWPYRLADKIDYEVNNQGLNGSSNASILRRTLEELSTTSYHLVIVGWTIPGRIEWKDADGPAYDVWPGYHMSEQFLDKTPWRMNLVEFVSQHHCAAYLYQQYLQQVILLQSYCEVKQIRLLMMDIFHNNYYRSAGQAQHNMLASQVNPINFVGWGQFGMYELTSRLPRGPGLHPLIRGHQKIADTFDEHLRNIGWIS